MRTLKPKLLHLASDTFKGGAESVFRNTIECTNDSKEFEVFVASCDKQSPCDIDKNHFLCLDDWGNYPKWRGALKYIFNLKNYKLLKAFLFQAQPDIIHTQNYLSRLSPSVLFALRAYKSRHPNIKLIYTQHGFGPCPNGGFYNYKKNMICEQCIGHSKLRIAYHNCDRRGRIHSILKAIRSLFYHGIMLDETKLFDTIICVGEFQKQKHIQDGVPESKLKVITNPIELRFLNQNITLEDKQDNIVFFGRLSPEKNIPLLIRAFHKLTQIPKFSQYKLFIIGDGDDRRHCLELAHELFDKHSTQAKIHNPAQQCTPQATQPHHKPLPCKFLGTKTPNELSKILQSAKLSVLPSKWYETFGLTIIESILSGVVPIASDLGAMKETIQLFHGKSFAFDPRSIDISTKNLEIVLVDTLQNYESEFTALLDRRKSILDTLQSKEYLEKLISVYSIGGGAIITLELSLLAPFMLAHSRMLFAPAQPPEVLEQILRVAKLSILPSLLQETFGLVVVESMLAGCPALVSNLKEPSTTAERFGGFVFDDLEKSLQEILGNYELYFAAFLQKRDYNIPLLLQKPYVRDIHSLYHEILNSK